MKTNAPALAVELNRHLSGIRQRTDADIASAAVRVLGWMSNLPPGNVKVAVNDGWVTLSGSVEWDYQRRSAIQAVRYLLDVTGVSDRVAVVPGIEPTLGCYVHGGAASTTAAFCGV